jgi:lipid II:glycine glycyltransferase (peptidoglycan interpeptide bridge formation enzyme)
MLLLRNHQISLEKWRGMLAISPYSSAFQTPDFYELCNGVPGISAEAFALEEDNYLKALCVVTLQKEPGIRGYFSRRAIIYGGPVLFDSDKESFNLLLKSIAEQFKRKVIYLEARNYFDYSQFHDHYIKAEWRWLPYLNVRLSLKEKSIEDVLASMKYNRKREIKLSLAEGAIYREAIDISEVQNLYLILKELYTKKVKLPVPNLEFFIKIFKSAIGKVFIVLHNNQIIGGSFCLYLEKKTIYTMYYCGLRGYQKNIFPTHLSILAAIDFGIRNNLEYLDFMGAGLRGKEYGVRKYKYEFGGELVEYGRYIRINNPFLYKVGALALKLIKKLKI